MQRLLLVKHLLWQPQLGWDEAGSQQQQRSWTGLACVALSRARQSRSPYLHLQQQLACFHSLPSASVLGLE